MEQRLDDSEDPHLGWRCRPLSSITRIRARNRKWFRTFQTEQPCNPRLPGSQYQTFCLSLIHICWGLENRDEINGIKCISKAGSLGYVNSMVELGEIWCSKSKYHKKDPHKAAAWLRLGEIFGVKSMGNSWIYKDKYMITKS